MRKCFGATTSWHQILVTIANAFVIQIEPDSTLALYNLGVLRMRQERLAEASSWLERAVASDPEFEDARRHLETVQRALENSDP